MNLDDASEFWCFFKKALCVVGKVAAVIFDVIGIAYAATITFLVHMIQTIKVPEGSTWAQNILILAIALYFAARAWNKYRKSD